MFASTYLTLEEMTALDDGQEWWGPGQYAIVGCSLPDEDTPNPAVQLSVENFAGGDGSHDNWSFWLDLPEAIRQRLLDDPLKVNDQDYFA